MIAFGIGLIPGKENMVAFKALTRPPVSRGNRTSRTPGMSRATVLGSRAGRRLKGISDPVFVTSSKATRCAGLDTKLPSLS